MDPVVTLRMALAGDRQAARDYNSWIQRGGFPARVSIHPAADAFMRGVRYADVRWVGRKYVTLAETTVRGFWTGTMSFGNILEVLS